MNGNPPLQINVSMSLKEVKCVSFTISEYGQESKSLVPLDKYEWEFKCEFSINEPEKSVSLILTTKLLEKQESDKIEISELRSLTIFNILNFNEVLVKNNNGIGIPDQLLITFYSLAISNTRGMYSVKLESTIYSNIFVPIIDARMLLPKKIEQVA